MLQNTTAAPVSCANVDILLSTDGGLTYPITLASGVTNDGSHDISVPNNITTTARIKVIGSGNIFFDISNTNFSIENTLSIEDNTLENFVIFPNPNNGSFIVKADGIYNNSIKITVFDLAGRQIFKKGYEQIGSNSTSIKLIGMKSGLYLVEIKSDEKSIIKKIIIK